MRVQSDSKDNTMAETHEFFFYGTLLVPAIVARVLGRECSDLTFQEAILPGYTRHCVKGEDYPAVISTNQTKDLTGEDVSKLDLSTRGTLVSGLTIKDVKALDIFEGPEYIRNRLPVQILSTSSPASNGGIDADGAQDANAQAWVYVWGESLSLLEANIWSFNEFMKEKAYLWAGTGKTNYFDDVERQRVSSPVESKVPQEFPEADESAIEGRVLEGYPDFGHNMLKYWKFDPKYVNLNHGSYGSPPRPVLDAMHKLSDQCEAMPDLFMRRSYLPILNEIRGQLANMLGAQAEEVVIVPNATQGVNNVLREIDWKQGDVIAYYSTTYGAVGQTIKYIADKNPVTIERIDLRFPCSHAEVLKKTEELFSKYNALAKPDYSGENKPIGITAHSRIRMLVVDTIASNPGVVYPWVDAVRLCKKYGVLSMVDGAHSIGQHKVDVKASDCDFFVTNCHKWLMSHRGGSVLYVPRRNQHLIRSTMPTSEGYESTKYPTEGIHREWTWLRQYEWTGTQDFTQFFSIKAALQFRKDIGGEERIMAYCHSLAVQGGRRLFKRWGTELMENSDLSEGELTAAMVNIALPGVPEPRDVEEQYKQRRYLEDGLLAKQCFAAPYRHGNKWWARFSAQLSDFDYVAEVLEGICEEMRRGLHHQHKSDVLPPYKPEDVPTQDE